ncbi:hypothetical protein L2E82_37699 [Cichorium intybus]|uniref:Uncharacterized protein n=1 Tax=Cichorium intybus TaxID=13427 RepID=A0ACB9AFJ0_CICIN|nr:hypothetical protein L2E82_37699 [Cichorium intybus]
MKMSRGNYCNLLVSFTNQSKNLGLLWRPRCKLLKTEEFLNFFASSSDVFGQTISNIASIILLLWICLISSISVI